MRRVTARRLVKARGALDRLFERYNRRAYVHPDPLEFLYGYPDLADREIVGLVASSLAYGRVRQILASVSSVLNLLGPAPAARLREISPGALRGELRTFKHRFTTGDEVASLLLGAREAAERHGSLHACFAAGLEEGAPTVLHALCAFASQLTGGRRNSLVPDPCAGSACKRLNLFLRWMVRSDGVDPGGWGLVPPSALIVPLDTHMHRICGGLGFTRRRNADMRTALEITEAFRAIRPGDPVRYDFALTRLGIRPDADPAAFLTQF
jgi:uncharacterized protein (TIGR02757 family)